MKLPRRRFLHLAAGAAALPALSRVAWAQAYPTRPVRIIVGFPAGGGADIVARLIGQWLSERLGQQFIIENRPGAGSNIATEAVVRATPDGYTLLLVHASNAFNATLYDKLNFNFIRDIAPVAGIIVVPNIMVVNPSVPARTVPELIAYTKVLPGYEATSWYGIGVPRNTPAEIVEKLNKEVNAALADPKMKVRLADLGVALPGSPAEFGKLIAEETEKWAKVIKFAGITPQ
jgi:tripartite-type tricarboxylate transporter receptor subunit TctC